MFLHGIELHGRHGVFDFERQTGQRFVVDVDWWIDTRAASACDLLDATICYKQLYDYVRDIVTGQPWALIETLCDRLVSGLLEQFLQIERLEVTVHKPEAPIGGAFADVGVTMGRCRSDVNYLRD